MTVMAEHETRTQLADLVRDRRARLGLSYAKLAERCVDPETGEQVKPSWLHRLETKKNVQPPSIPEIRGMAAGLEVPQSVVQEAAGAQFFGIDTVWSASGEVRAMAARMDEMTPERREQLLRLIEAFSSGRHS